MLLQTRDVEGCRGSVQVRNQTTAHDCHLPPAWQDLSSSRPASGSSGGLQDWPGHLHQRRQPAGGRGQDPGGAGQPQSVSQVLQECSQ